MIKEELGKIRKSRTLTLTITECDIVPEVAVTTMVMDPAVAEVTESVDTADPEARLTLFAPKLAAALVVARVTIPLKLLVLVRVKIVLL